MENSLSQTLATAILLLTIFPTIESLCSDTMATTLSSSGFTLFAHALHAYGIATNGTTGLTFLVPPDNTLVNHGLDAATVSGHVSNDGAFPHQSLLSIPPNTSLTTLHNTSLNVGTDGERVSFNDVLVVLPNLYIDGSCAVHGVDRPLVPISSSSSGDDQNPAKPRMEKISSPVSKRLRARGTLEEYMRFIRRANLPKGNEETRSP